MRGIVIFQNFIFPIHFYDGDLVPVERQDLSPQHDLDSEGETSEKWKDDGRYETDKEWQEWPGGEHEEEEEDEDEVCDHPGDQEQVLVKDGAQEQQEGQGEMEDHGSDDPIQDRVVIMVNHVKVGLCHVQHLQMSGLNVEWVDT